MTLGPVRARDLRANITEMGFERGMSATLEAALDQQAEIRQHLRDLTELVDKCITEVSKMVSVGSRLRDELADMRRLRDQSGDVDGTLHD